MMTENDARSAAGRLVPLVQSVQNVRSDDNGRSCECLKFEKIIFQKNRTRVQASILHAESAPPTIELKMDHYFPNDKAQGTRTHVLCRCVTCTLNVNRARSKGIGDAQTFLCRKLFTFRVHYCRTLNIRLHYR